MTSFVSCAIEKKNDLNKEKPQSKNRNSAFVVPKIIQNEDITQNFRKKLIRV